jgi:hypothetical protein
MLPTVLDLLILGVTLHNDSLHYKLLQRQCYWFAVMFVMTLDTTYDSVGGNPDPSTGCQICQDCKIDSEGIEEGKQGKEEGAVPHEKEIIQPLAKVGKPVVLM